MCSTGNRNRTYYIDNESCCDMVAYYWRAEMIRPISHLLLGHYFKSHISVNWTLNEHGPQLLFPQNSALIKLTIRSWSWNASVVRGHCPLENTPMTYKLTSSQKNSRYSRSTSTLKQRDGVSKLFLNLVQIIPTHSFVRDLTCTDRLFEARGCQSSKCQRRVQLQTGWGGVQRGGDKSHHCSALPPTHPSGTHTH